MTATIEQRMHELERQVAELRRALAEREPGAAVRDLSAPLGAEPPSWAPFTASSTQSWPPPGVSRPDVPPVGPERSLPRDDAPPWVGTAAPQPMTAGTAAGTWAAPYYPRPPSPPSRRRQRPAWDFERLLAARLLGLVGGVAVVIGIAFFVGLAVNRGWVGVPARLVMAASASAALLAVGCWLYERRGRPPGALAVAATGIAGLYLTLTATTAGYHLLPEPAALVCAMGIGALATAVAVRWDSRTVAGLGLGGTMAAPLLAGVLTASGLAFLAVSGAAAVAVLVWRRWQWLAIGTSALMLGQVAWWSATPRDPLELTVTLIVFALLNLALGLGYELRDPAAAVQPAAALLVPFGVLLVGLTGYAGLPHGPGERAGALWLLGLAALHGALAVAARLSRRVSVEVQVALVAATVVLGDVAAAVLGHGWSLTVGWTSAALGLAVLARREPRHAVLLQLVLGAQLALAVGHVLVIDARPHQLVTGQPIGAGAAAGVVSVMVAAFATARIVPHTTVPWRAVLDGLTVVALAYVTALSLDDAALLLAWAVAAVVLARTAERWEDHVAGVGSLGLLVCLCGHVLAFDAPPPALLDGLRSPLLAVLGLLIVAGVALLLDRLMAQPPGVSLRLRATAAAAVLYLGSTVVVDMAGPVLGQTLLSVGWAVCGTAVLVAGLRRREAALRIGGSTLLALAVTKVFLYDLGALHAAYRVGSFLGIGLVLLVAGLAYPRLQEVG